MAAQGNKYRQSPFSARTQQDVAALLGVSREHVGKAERRAVRKLQEAIEREAAAAGCSVRQWLFGGMEAVG